jgi:hypothetical protein
MSEKAYFREFLSKMGFDWSIVESAFLRHVLKHNTDTGGVVKSAFAGCEVAFPFAIVNSRCTSKVVKMTNHLPG